MNYIRQAAVNILAHYFNRVKVPESFNIIQSSPLSTNSPRPTIVTQSSSCIIEALILSFARRSGIQKLENWSEIVNKSGSPSSAENRLTWASIHDERTLRRIFEISPGETFVTLNVFEKKGPARNVPSHKIGLLRLLRIALSRRFFLVLFGSPISVPAEAPDAPKRLNRILKLDYIRNLKVVRGTPFQPLSLQEDIVLSGPEFERELGIISQRMGKSKEVARKLSRAAFREIAADPISWLYGLVAFGCGIVHKRLFGEVHSRGLEGLREAVRHHTVVLVPMHRSHFDYMILGTKLYESNLNPPIVAAGINLSAWPFGFFIRSLGGYFVKRNARGDRVHALILKRYVSYLVKRGHLQEFFIEGGRSRSGKMARPKLGLLSIIVSSYMKAIKRDILFVPVSITYENVMEGAVFGEENTGRSKVKENLVSLFRARDFFLKRYGNVMVTFGDAISLKSFSEQHKAGNTKGTVDEKRVVQNLGDTLIKQIEGGIQITLTSLAHAALMNSRDYALRRGQLVSEIVTLNNLVEIYRKVQRATAEPSSSLAAFLEGKHALLDEIVRSGVTSQHRCLNEDVFYIPGKSRYTADFYRNSSVHAFLLPALLALSSLVHGEIDLNSIKVWHGFLSYDFQLQDWVEFEEILKTWISELRNSGIIVGNSLPDKNRAASMAAPILPWIQSIIWVMLNLRDNTSEGENGAKWMWYEPFIALLQDDFRVAEYLGVVSRTEAASRVNLIAAIDTLYSLNFIAIEESQGKRSKISIVKDFTAELSFLSNGELAIRDSLK